MVSRFVFAIVALSFISFESGYLVKRESGVGQECGASKRRFDAHKEMVKGTSSRSVLFI